MLTVMVIPADDTEPITKREIEGQLSDYQGIVGGLIEATDFDRTLGSIYSNEEGLLIGLPINVRATALLHMLAPRHRSFTVLVGDCVVVGQPDEEGNTTSCPQVILDMYRL